jgi:VCBS repeat-containing protein
MANNKGKSKATNGDDVLVGTPKNDTISGKRGDDQISGLAGHDKLKGDKGNDVLDGGPGNDRLHGGKGDDTLLGGSGNDVLYGDDGKSSGHGWGKFLWWKPQSDHDDYLDGGAGNDKVYGGRGDDVAVYDMAENLGARDEYDGGTGSDTLVLRLTYGEARLASVQSDIAAFETFLDRHAGSRSDHGREFEFKSFNLDVRNFEALQIELVNRAPTANGDSAATNEDTPLVLAGAALLANDTDPDHLDVIKVTGAAASSALGAAVTVALDGAVRYDPSGAALLQALGAGHTATDSFSYTISDIAGATSSASVTVTVAGVNDAPVSGNDSNATGEDTPGAGNLLANDDDIDNGDTISVAFVNGSAANVGATITLASGALLTVNSDGSYSYNPNGQFESLDDGESAADSFTYAVKDNHGLAGNTATVLLTVSGVNDAPVAAGDAASTDEDTPVSGDVLANDTDVEEDDLTATLVDGPSNGTLTLNADGSYTYTPNANYFGTDSFSYKANDGDLDSSVATVSLTINAVNDAPVANGDSYTLSEDTTLTVPAAGVLANDTDVDSPALSAALVSGAAHGTVVLSADGSFTYTPNANFFGSDSFAYKANDGALDSPITTVSLTVTDVAEPEPPAPPSKVLPSVGPGANLDYYIRFEGQEWMRLEGFSLGFSQSGSLSGGGGGAGKATATDVHSTLGTSGQLVELSSDLNKGKHIANAEIEVYGTGEKPQLLEQYYFEDVLLTSLQTGGSSGGGTLHNLSFDYAAFNRGLVTQDAKGGVGAIVEDGFDFQQAIDADGLGPAITGDALKAKLEDVDSGANLQYYVSWEGSGGWLDLSSFSVGVVQTGSVGSGGAGAGKASATDLSFTLGASAQLLQLEDALTSGKHLQNLEIEAYRIGEKPQLVDQYYFEDLLVSSLQTSNSVFNTVSVEFGKFSRGHVEMDEKGGIGQTTEAGWSFITNEVFHTPVDSDLF